MNFEDFEEDDEGNPTKRVRFESQVERDDMPVRSQARFSAELVDIYYIRSSAIHSGSVNKDDNYNAFCSLDDLVPSLAQQVGATAHYFQLLNEKNVPVSFAHSTKPLEPPKRPFLATVLAVLVQGCVLESSGVFISTSRFDFWFNAVNGSEGSSISSYWLDALMHIAWCFAKKCKVNAFGQEIVWKHFEKLRTVSSFQDRINYMVVASVGGKNTSLGFNDSSFYEFSSPSLNAKSYLLLLWRKSFMNLSFAQMLSVKEKPNVADSLFFQGVDRTHSFVSQILEFLENSICNSSDVFGNVNIHLLCSGTAGEYAAICFFLAIKSILNDYSSNVPTTKRNVEQSSDVLAALFCQFVQYFNFVTPSLRHYHLLDECQFLLQEPKGPARSLEVNTSSSLRLSRQKKRDVSIFEEDEFTCDMTPTRVVLGIEESANDVLSATPLFSHCIFSTLRHRESISLLVDCLQKQVKVVSGSEDFSRAPSSGGNAKYEKGTCHFFTSSESQEVLTCDAEWCELELGPVETGNEEKKVQNFLRCKKDMQSKRAVDKANEESRQMKC